LPHSIDEFMAFYEQRRGHLVSRIQDKLKTQAPEPSTTGERQSATALDEALAEGDDED
jgi:hypothetical protein